MTDIQLLGPLLGRCAHLAKERMDARLKAYDVTPAQIHVLHYLYHHQNTAPQCEVTQHLKVKPSTAAGILDRMEERGLVARTVSGTDARRRLITLTEKGCALQSDCQRIFLETEELMMADLTAEERETLFGLLLRVITNLEEDREA